MCIRVDEYVAFDVGVEACEVVVALQLVVADADDADAAVELEVDLDALEWDEGKEVRSIGIGSGQGDLLRCYL